jgi:predicted ATPase
LKTGPIGRQMQVDTLLGWVRDLSAGRGRVVYVEGVPGIGKTSLVRTAATGAGSSGCRVVWATLR